MEALFILLPATLLIGGLFVSLFIFSVNKGQFEELEGPANRAILEDQKAQGMNEHASFNNKGKKNGSKQEL